MKEVSTEELVDLVNEQGNVKMIAVPRGEVDLHPKLYMPIVVAVVFDNLGRVLVHQRALSKKVNPGEVDLVCGGIFSGELPEVAAIRETHEETGVTPENLTLVAKGVNSYKRFRYLYSGYSDQKSLNCSPEAGWIRFMYPNELYGNRDLGKLQFVNEFFEDLEIAVSSFQKRDNHIVREAR